MGPTARIGASVLFNDVINAGTADGVGPNDGTTWELSKGIALCNPAGLLPEDCATCNGVEPASTRTLEQNIDYYSGVAGGTNGATLAQLAFWDPITAAQASGGAFCCDALYYGRDGPRQSGQRPAYCWCDQERGLHAYPLRRFQYEHANEPRGCVHRR